MSYIGATPAESYASFYVQHFTTSATTSYALDYPVVNENDLRLVINNVVQQPGSGKAYTAAASTLTLSAATTTSDAMYTVFLGRALQTVNPPAGSVGTSQLADGTQGDILYYGASGAPALLGFGTSGDFLKTQGTGANPTWAAAGGGKINQIVSVVQPIAAVISVANDTTWYDIGLTASITPSASDSTVLIMASVCGSLESGNFTMSFQFVRDSTPINLGTASGSRTPVSWGTGVQSGGNYDIQNAGHMFLDSPATTSATAYKVQLRSTRDGTDWYRNRGWYDTDASSTFLATSTITLFEVLA